VSTPTTDQEGETAMSPHIATISTPALRELASREADGLRIRLLWSPPRDTLTIAVHDTRSGGRMRLPVPRTSALDAFHHPFSYLVRDAIPVRVSAETSA
jgi:hypothetical protein